MVRFSSRSDAGRRQDWSLRSHLIAFALVLILPIAAVSGLAVARFAASERKATESRATVAAHEAMLDVDAELESDITILDTLATSLYLDSGDYASFQRVAARIAARRHAHVLLLDPSLRELMNTRVPYGTKLPRTADPDTARKVLATGEPQVSGLFMGSVARHYVFNVDAPVLRGGKVAFILIITIEPSRILGILKAQPVPSGWAFTVVDRDHRVIARTVDPAQSVGRQALIGPGSTLPGRASGLVRNLSFGGTPILSAFTTSPLTGWIFAAWVPTATLEGPLRRSWELFALGIGGLLAVSLGAAILFGRMMARPIKAVRKDAIAFGHGETVGERRFALREANAVSAAFRAASLERRKQEAHLTLLVGELSHRTKNLLAVMQAMVRQTRTRSTSLDDFESRFSGRLLGLGRSIDLLVRADWRGAELADLAAAQLSPFAEPGGGRLEIVGPPVWLRPEATQQIGMALHELATNSTKYGAFSTPGGRVRFGWTLRPDEAGPQTVRLAWEEAGGPPVAKQPVERGFGRVLIEQAVAASLQGEVTVEFAPEGLRWSLTFPASYIVRPEDVGAYGGPS